MADAGMTRTLLLVATIHSAHATHAVAVCEPLVQQRDCSNAVLAYTEDSAFGCPTCFEACRAWCETIAGTSCCYLKSGHNKCTASNGSPVFATVTPHIRNGPADVEHIKLAVST